MPTLERASSVRTTVGRSSVIIHCHPFIMGPYGGEDTGEISRNRVPLREDKGEK